MGEKALDSRTFQRRKIGLQWSKFQKICFFFLQKGNFHFIYILDLASHSRRRLAMEGSVQPLLQWRVTS